MLGHFIVCLRCERFCCCVWIFVSALMDITALEKHEDYHIDIFISCDGHHCPGKPWRLSCGKHIYVVMLAFLKFQYFPKFLTDISCDGHHCPGRPWKLSREF
ncbi:uncharacterized protein LOC105683178 [Athalia rosae]|uniref:uncharacterized protein LOC105683178 n=1 Tax=Athalia rosae TaxID=37344 RepID=UPI002033E722|nr:uncharacterized protein LOC105683178 [Athalia rosae]